MMWGPWHAPMWGLWWIFPLVGFVLCLTFVVMAVRFIATGRGCMCMGGDGHGPARDSRDVRREIDDLREEITRLKAARPPGAGPA
jgi:hypothetical protein